MFIFLQTKIQPKSDVTLALYTSLLPNTVMIWLRHGQLLLLLYILYLYIDKLCNFVCQPLKMIVLLKRMSKILNFRHVRPTPSECTSDTKDIQEFLEQLK